MFMTDMLLWWTLHSVRLPILIKSKAVKEALCNEDPSGERKCKVTLVTSIKPNKRIEVIMQYILFLLNRTFVRRTRPVATEGQSVEVPQNFLGLPKFCCVQKDLFQTYNKNKILPLKYAFCSPNLKT